jgi:hypothetical protein
MIDPVAIATPQTDVQAGTELTNALVSKLHQVPPEQLGVYLMALIWLETDRGLAIIRNNVGNLMAKYLPANGGQEVSVFAGEFWRPDWWFDESHPTHAAMMAGKEPSAFRAYPTAQDGYLDYVALLLSAKNAPVIAAAMADDPVAFVRALKKTYSAGYTDNVADSIRSLVAAFRSKGFFAPFKGVQMPGTSQAMASLNAPSSGAGGTLAALAILAVVGGIFIATMRIKPGSRRRLAAA